MFAVIDVHLSLLLVIMPFAFLLNVALAYKSVFVWIKNVICYLSSNKKQRKEWNKLAYLGCNAMTLSVKDLCTYPLIGITVILEILLLQFYVLYIIFK